MTIRYVNTNSTSGGDGTTNATTGANRAYPSIKSAIIAEASDITGLGDFEILCDGGLDSDFVVASDWTGWTTTATDRVAIKVNPANAPTPLTFDSTKFRFGEEGSWPADGSSSNLFAIGDGTNAIHVTLAIPFYKSVSGVSSGTARNIVELRAFAEVDVIEGATFDMRTLDQLGGGAHGCFEGNSNAGLVTVNNALFAGNPSSNGSTGAISDVLNRNGGQNSVNNCIFVNFDKGVENSLTSASTNNIFQNVDLEFTDTTPSEFIRNNLTSNASMLSISANDQLSKTLTFVGGDNYNLAGTAGDNASVEGTGVGPTAEASVRAVDVYGNPRSGATSDIGAYEVVAIPASIANVDTDNTLVDGQQDVSFTVADFGGDITSASLEVGASEIALTGVTGTGNSGTFDLMDVTTLTSGTAGLPFSSATYQNAINLSDGTDSASINITRNPKAGWAIAETASAVSTEGSMFEGRTGGAPSDDSQIYYPTTGNTSISATGIITTDLETPINGFVWDVTSGEWETFTFTAADTVAPVITVSGNASTTIPYQGTAPTFTATASDARDGDITNDIVVSGDTVDVNTAGTYVIRYNVSDAAGNAATEVTRTVIVSADAVSPVINVSGNATTTIAFGATVPTFTATVTDNSGETITPVLSGDTVDNQTAGTYVLRWNASDSAGNAATEVTRTVIVQAEVDTQAPVITVSGQPTTTIDFGGTAPTFTSSTDDGSTVVVSGDTVDVNTAGTYVIRFNATDAAGNQATEVTRTVIVQNEVDTQAPVITVTGDETTTIAYGATVPTFTATTDDGSTVVVGGDTVDNQTAGTYVITYNATDSAGNQATQVTRTVIVQAEVISSTATFTVTGTPDADYTVDFHNPTTGALIRRVADVTFTDGEASVVLSDVAVGTSYRAVVFTSTHLFGNVGVTA